MPDTDHWVRCGRRECNKKVYFAGNIADDDYWGAYKKSLCDDCEVKYHLITQKRAEFRDPRCRTSKKK